MTEDSDKLCYVSPLSSRYASKEMSSLFSDRHRYITWRKLWLALAKAEKSLGIAITDAQIQTMESHLHEIDFHLVASYEKSLKHDVMAHLHAFGDVCPGAKGIIHLGATSCYVTDNTDLILIKEALCLLQTKVITIVRLLASQAEQYKSLPTLSYTHLQPAQPTTYGKRIALWLQDLLMDLHDMEERIENLYFLGVKGATGTQASFLTLFDGDMHKVKALEEKVAAEMGFQKIIPLSSQTYTRKQDVRVCSMLASFAASAHKMATDLRLLAHMGEVLEPSGKSQVGSSAMPHKKNPILSERICSLARFVITLEQSPLQTAALQWLERSLDDSANRRLVLPEILLTTDAICNLLIHLISGMKINEKAVQKNLSKEIPFIALEGALMLAAKRGGDRQKLHEILRRHSIAAKLAMQEEDAPSSILFDLIAEDENLSLTKIELQSLTNPAQYIGAAKEQVEDFLTNIAKPILHHHQSKKSYSPEEHI